MKKDVPYLRADVVKALVKETPPRCFHCGDEYVKDNRHCGATHNTWMPNCTCLNKSTIRIVTGGEIIYGEEQQLPDYWNE